MTEHSCLTMHKLTVKFMLLFYVLGHTAAPSPVKYWISNETDFGPVINVFCRGSESNFYRWVSASKTLAEGEELIDADPTRYSVSVGCTYDYEHEYTYGSLLTIKNVIKEDSGIYECQLDDYITNNKQSGQISVQVRDYLPSLSFPKCLISPSTTLYDKSDAIFKCMAGESSASLNLLLTLRHQNGSIVELGHDVVTTTIYLNDNNATFICHMTSKTFPTAYRNCSAGPMTIQEMLHTSIKDSTKIYSIHGIIVGSIAAFLLVIIVATICIITHRKFGSGEHNPVHLPVIRNSTGDRNPPNQEDSSNLTSRHGNSEQIPVYAEVQEPISQNLSEDTITYAYADANLSTFSEETMTFPIYSKVNETDQTDISNNEADDESSTGMVENTTYVSSGPV